MKAPANTTWPVLVPKGKGPCKIYLLSVKGVEMYSVHFRVLGRLQRRAYVDYARALTAAREAAKLIEKSEASALVMKDKQRAEYARALEHLQGLKVDIDAACRDYAAAIKTIGKDTTLMEAARFYAEHHKVKYPSITVKDLATKLLDAKKAGEQTKLSARKPRQSSERYLYDLKLKLDAFADRFACPISNTASINVRR